jgi:hypothetical protein
MIHHINILQLTLSLLCFSCNNYNCLDIIDNATEMLYCCDMDLESSSFSSSSVVTKTAKELFTQVYYSNHTTNKPLNLNTSMSRFEFKLNDKTCEVIIVQLTGGDIVLTFDLRKYQVVDSMQLNLIYRLDDYLHMDIKR